MISLKNVTKIYHTKENVIALKNINFSLNSRGFTVLLGKSGSGKSTLLNLLGGLDSYDSGDILINNYSLSNLNKDALDTYRKFTVGTVFQDAHLIDEFTIGRNISLAVGFEKIPKMELENRINSVLSAVDLKGYQNYKPNEISRGEQQRVAIARALIKKPSIILADEPTGNLDSKTSELILKLLKELSKDTLVIIATHDKSSAKYADRIIELKDGQISQDIIKNDQDDIEQNITYKTNKTYLTNNHSLKLAFIYLFCRKIRLFFMMFLFVFSLILLGIFLNLSLFDTVKSSVNTFENKEIEMIPFYKEVSCGDNDFKKRSINDDNIREISTHFPSLSLVKSISSNSFIENNSYSIDTVKILNSENQDNIELLYGNYPIELNEILIAETLARELINDLGANTIEDLIDMKITYNNIQFKIAGIIPEKNVTNLWHQLIYTSQETYDKSIHILTKFNVKLSQGIKPYFVSKPDLNYENYLVPNSKFPDKDNEVILTFSFWKYVENPDYLIGKKAILNLSSYQIFSDEQEFDIVGVIDDINNEIDVPFMLMVNNNIFNYFDSEMISIDVYLNEKVTLQNFLEYMENNNFKHNTDYSGNLYKINTFIYNSRYIILGLGLFSLILTLLLFYSYISISIHNKHNDIGILRSIGASGKDVAKIFLLESIIVGLICAFIANILLHIILIQINLFIQEKLYFPIEIFYTNIYSFLFVLFFSLFISYLSTFIPLKLLTRMKPIDVIKKNI